MASSAAVAVDDDPVVAVATGNGTRHDIAVRNNGPNTVYIGGSAVTSTTGFPLGSGDDMAYTLGESETLHGVCASGESAALRVIQAA